MTLNNYLELIEALAPPSQSLTTIFISFVLLAAYCAGLVMIYKRHRNNYDMNLEPSSILALSGVTFLIVVVIQDSITLSLGMVGALSIVRFRTPIKNPFELIYLFAGIGFGVGFGSGKILIAAFVGVLVLIGMICIVNLGRLNLRSTRSSMNARVKFNDANLVARLRSSFDFNYIEISGDEIFLEFDVLSKISLEEFLTYCESNQIIVVSASFNNQ